MKSLVELSVHILRDCGMRCGADPSRDIKTVTRRTQQEGDSFLTITLPSFCKMFERALAEGSIPNFNFPGFRNQRKRRLPRFLGGFVGMVFGPDGVLLGNPDVEAIACIRQVCLLHKKVEQECSIARQLAAIHQFSQVEEELRGHVYDKALYSTFCQVSRIVWSDLLSSSPFGLDYERLVPRHGPGSTQERIRGNRKFEFQRWHSRLEPYFPYTEFGISSIRNYDMGLQGVPVTYLPPRDEPPVKVCLVPKTMKTPRVIASEPVCMQYSQQALADWLRELIEGFSVYTKGHVFFRDQSHNSNLARVGSLTGEFASLDMSEASDRVSSRLVRDMLAVCPHLRSYVFACRSTRARLPGGTTVPLRKFASMGSALCFPIESIAFFLAVVSTRLQNAGTRVTPRSVRKYISGVSVFGDDIIVPNDEAPLVCKGLEAMGFKVNRDKSFWSGNFRESCGGDWFSGENVKPVYLRVPIRAGRIDDSGLVSLVASANQLYRAGFWGAAKALRQHVEQSHGVLPSVRTTSQVVGWHSYSNAMSFSGWDKVLQCLRLKALVPVPTRMRDHLDGDAALLKCFRTIGVSDEFGVLSVPVGHLETSVRYGSLALKRRWTSA